MDESDLARRIKQSERMARLTKAGQNIAPIPDIVNPQRRAAASQSYRAFIDSYFQARFPLQFSPDHLQVIAREEEAARHGGLFWLAMARGGGKTSLAEVLCLWATMNGLHQFVMLLAVSSTRGNQVLQALKTELLTNDLLYEDWPEICHPVRELQDRANRAKGQHIDGSPTYIGWRSSEIVLPTVAGSAASGAVIRCAGITSGGVRGPKYVRQVDGANVRPSLVILDDPQDDKSARSPYQCENRHRTIHGAVLGMAGPGKKITAIGLGTVIAKGDLCDRMLDRKQSPLWTGQRYQLLPRFPDRMDLWQEYAERRSDELRNDGDGHLATAWYGEQKEIMDRGAVASWPERRNPDELSAIQHAMNLFFLDARSFMSEYQNDPQPEDMGGDQLEAAAVTNQLNGLPRGTLPLRTSHVVAYVDVQQKVLYWLVAAFGDDLSCAVVDYGTYPDQNRAFFQLSEIQRTLGRAAQGAGVEGAIYAGLTNLAGALLNREWKREDGAAIKIERMLVDAGYQGDTVKTWCRQTPFSGIVMPAHGRGIGAKGKPLGEYIKHPGERIGFHWMVSGVTGKNATRHLLIDTYFWKSFVAERMRMSVGDRGALTLWGRKPEEHRLFADHMTAEYSTKVEANGRQVLEWQIRPDKRDNHWFDCLVGCCAAASLQGGQVQDAQPKVSTGKRKTLQEMQEEARRKKRG